MLVDVDDDNGAAYKVGQSVAQSCREYNLIIVINSFAETLGEDLRRYLILRQ